MLSTIIGHSIAEADDTEGWDHLTHEEWSAAEVMSEHDESWEYVQHLLRNVSLQI